MFWVGIVSGVGFVWVGYWSYFGVFWHSKIVYIVKKPYLCTLNCFSVPQSEE